MSLNWALLWVGRLQTLVHSLTQLWWNWLENWLEVFRNTDPRLFSQRTENSSSIDRPVDSYKLGSADQRHWLPLPWIFPTNAICKQLNTQAVSLSDFLSLAFSLLIPNATFITHNSLKKEQVTVSSIIRIQRKLKLRFWVMLIHYLIRLVLALELHSHTQMVTHKNVP